MSLRDEITKCVFGRDHYDWRGCQRIANSLLALLRERGKPMLCASILFDEWVPDDDPAAAAEARFVLLDMAAAEGRETEGKLYGSSQSNRTVQLDRKAAADKVTRLCLDAGIDD